MNILLTLVVSLIVLTGCSSRDVNRDIYDALIKRECIKKTGEPNCESGQPNYEEYKREREAINKQE